MDWEVKRMLFNDDLGLSSIFISLKIVLLSTFFVTFFGVVLAYFLSQKKFKAKAFVESILTLPLVLPPTVLGYYLIVLLGRKGILGEPLYQMLEVHLTFSWYGGVIAAFCVALPLMIKVTKTSFDEIDPYLIETAKLLGHKPRTIFFRILLPLSYRGIVAGVVLSFARGLGEFGATLMFAGNIPGRTTTMPLAIYNYSTNGQWKEAHLLALILTLFSILFLLSSEFFMKRRSR